jgi:hypothetical protein
MLNQVFISYRQESPEHARAVSRLGELLKQAGLPVELDQFYLDKNPGGPDEGWPKWCEDRANQAACVIVIASPGWFAAYEGTGAPGIGCGAAVEASLFRQFLYDEKGINPRIRLALLGPLPPGCAIPERLRAWHQFHPFADNPQLDGLVAWIAQRLGLGKVESPTVRWPDANDDFTPDLADRVETEWEVIKQLLSGRARERILLFEGGSGLGKSLLLRQAVIYAKSRGIAVCRVDFKSTRDVTGALGQVELDLGTLLPNFARDGGAKTHLLRKDLRALRQPVLLIFDSYDQNVADNTTMADWLHLQILNEVETSLGLAVVVAGQRTPDFVNAGWCDLARHMTLAPITEAAHWEPWIQQRYPSLRAKGVHLPTVIMIARGNPAVVSASCEAMEKS